LIHNKQKSHKTVKVTWDAPYFIAFILGPGAEWALRQALRLSGNGPMIVLERSMAGFFILLAVTVIGWRTYQTKRDKYSGLPPKDIDGRPLNVGGRNVGRVD
jgi:TctA family transporter